MGSNLTRALYLYGGMAVRILSTLALIPLLGRNLGPEGYGIYSVAHMIAMMVWQIVEFGTPLIASRLYASASGQNDRDTALSIATFSRLTMIPLSLAAATAAIFYSEPLRNEWAVIGLAVLLGIQCGMNFGWMLTAQGESRLQATFETVPAVLTLLMCALWVRSTEDVVTAFIIMNVAAAGVNLFAWRHARKHAKHIQLPEGVLADALRKGLYVFAYRAALTAMGYGSAYLLTRHASADTVGHYALADRILTAATGLLQPLTVVLFPGSMRMFAEDPYKASRVYGKIVLKIFGIASACTVAGMLILPYLIPLLMGAAYESSTELLMILLPALPLMALSQLLVQCYLYPLHLDKQIALIYVLSGALLWIGAQWSIPAFGVHGMAWLRVSIELLLASALALSAFVAMKRS
ncbi:lipopolysaccharide biosynthesis protein [Sphaerotilus hippei]|uniref:lipopolysaccharide biosynthesis protein n=1 Tax=Sphaerotilus hippei TaxID=744406 RepID=UPI001B85C788|nr:lipopolysaccharide biosynthesis protein [Sphaerotilus hippei]